VARRAAVLVTAAIACPLLSGCFASPPQIIALDPPRGSVGVQADAPIEVEFDRPVVPSSLAGRLTITPGLPGCDPNKAFTATPSDACRISWIAEDTAFVLQHPHAIFAPLKTYTFTVLGGFSDPAGVVNSVDHRWNLTTGSAPLVRSISPVDGSRAVPIDSVLTVAFSGGMALDATTRAIQLSPAVPGSRVVRNALDASRFVLYPGRLLEPDTHYQLTIATTATDLHRQPLGVPASVGFTTGTLGTGAHGVVLAQRAGGAPSTVLITALAPAETGAPVAADIALESPRCQAAGGCGNAVDGAPLLTYRSAVLSSRGGLLAVVEDDAVIAASPPQLVVIDVATGTVKTVVSGADFPSWSTDGTTLAYAHGNTAALFDVDTGMTRSLPDGDPLLAPAVWGPRGELLALDTGADAAHSHVELADTVAGARYALPGVTDASSTPVISPDGSQLALLRQGAGSKGTWLVGVGSSTAPLHRLDVALSPVGYSSSGTLIAVANVDTGAQLVRVSVDSDQQVPLVHQPDLPASSSVSPSVRRLVFLARDSTGVLEAYVENSDGTDPLALTSLSAGGLEATAVTLSG